MSHRKGSIELEERLVEKAALAHIPITANFELTPVCNFRCDMCFICTPQPEVNRLGGLRPAKDWLRLAEQLRSMGTLFILLTGGEPLLHPDFREIYTELRNMGFILTLNTNGSLIDEDICQMFAQQKPRRVNVTLYGGSAETYKRLCHNEAGWDKTMEALRLLRQYDIDTKLNVSVVEQNKQDYEAIMQVARDLDIPAVVNSYMFPALRSHCRGLRDVDAERITPEEAADFSLRYMAYKCEDEPSDYRREILDIAEHAPAIDEPQGITCRAGSTSMWINWRHRLSPCVMMEEPSIDLDEVELPEAWPQLVEQCQQIEPYDDCRGCNLRLVCEVCYAAVEHEKKVRGNVDYLCQMTRQKLKLVTDEKRS